MQIQSSYFCVLSIVMFATIGHYWGRHRSSTFLYSQSDFNPSIVNNFNIIKICPPYCASVLAFHLSWILPQLFCESINAKAQTLLLESLTISTSLYILRDLSPVCDPLHNIINVKYHFRFRHKMMWFYSKTWFSY